MKMQSDQDRLDAHFKALNQSPARARLIETAPDVSEGLMSLFGIADLLWRILRPVAVSPAFRQELGMQLRAEARRRQTRRVLGYYPQRPGLSPVWLVPVAALGTVSLVGAIFWRRARQNVEGDAALAA